MTTLHLRQIFQESTTKVAPISQSLFDTEADGTVMIGGDIFIETGNTGETDE